MNKVRRRKVELRRRKEGTGDENNARRERRKGAGEERVKAESRKGENYKYCICLFTLFPNFTIFV